jgi:hypothetical protein
MKVQVQCYAGMKADERPVRFRLEEHEHMVEEVLDQWYGPEHLFFKVRADDTRVTFCGAPRCLTKSGIWFRFGTPVGVKDFGFWIRHRPETCLWAVTQQASSSSWMRRSRSE